MMTKPKTQPRIGRINRQRLRTRNMEIRFGTWNARSLKNTGDLKSLVEEMKSYRLQLLAIQETRWNSSERVKHGEYTFFSSSGKQRMFGVAFAVHKSLLSNVLAFRPINERLCAIRIKTKFFNLRFINVHAEHESIDDDTKDAFYQQLESECDKSPSNDIKIVIGDFNAKIGREEIHRPVIGKESLHAVSNDNGLRVIDFATSRNMVVSSTYFPRKDIHKYTWESPDKQTRNQIDHVLIDKRGASSIMNIRTYRGADCNSDHHLVGGIFRCRISSNPAHKFTKCKKFDTDKLKDEKTLDNYQLMLGRQLNTLKNNETEDINEMWQSIKNTVSKVAENSIGYAPKQKKNDWYDDECKKAVQRRKELRLACTAAGTHCTRSKLNEYKLARKKAKNICRKKKRQYMNEHIIRMQKKFEENDPRKAYKEINFFRKGYKPSISICRDASGEILVGEAAVKKRWKEFFEQLLNENSVERCESNLRLQEEVIPSSTSEETEPPTLEEVERVVRALKNNKAPGKDNLPAELFKYGGEELVEALHAIIKHVWINEKIPKEWEESIIIPIYKKGDKFECKNHRGISLLNSAYKILTSVIKNRMEPYAEKAIGDYQAGFRKNRSTMDQLFTVRQTLRKCWEFDIDVYQLFVDFRQAYDSIDREKLYSTMLNLGIPLKLVKLTKATMNSSRCTVRIQGELSEEFTVEKGLKQGDGLAPMLFNLALEGVIRKIDSNALNGNLCYKSKQLAGYADDINCLARSLRGLTETFVELEKAAQEVGLQINEDKTKILLQTRKKRQRLGQNVTIDEHNFEVVNEFKYLGSILTSDNDEVSDVQERIKAANRAYFSLLPVMKSNDVNRETKVMLYKTLIRSVATYGGEAWTLTEKTSDMLDIFERKILRRIYGPVKSYNPLDKTVTIRMRYNNELYRLYKAPSISEHIKLMRLRWAGHVQRYDDERIAKKMIDIKPSKCRPKGRPRSRWEENVQNDAEVFLKVKNWRKDAENRALWRKRLMEAMAKYEL